MNQQESLMLAEKATSLPHLMQLLQEHGSDGIFDSWAIRRFTDIRARERGIPLSGRFEITPFCNLDCKMCYVHMQKDQLGNKSLLSADTWEALMQEAIDAGMMYASLTGGECLASPDFDRLYLFLHSQGVPVAILTNGVLLDEARIRFFQKHPPACLYITLYGNSEDTYEQVTGHRRFEQVMHNIRIANEALLPIHLSITPNKYMGDKNKALLRFVASLGLPFDVNTVLMTPREETGRSNDFGALAVTDYMQLLKLEKSLKGQLPPIECVVDLPEPNGNSNAKVPCGLRCGAARSVFTATWDGKIIPCNALHHVGVPYEKGNFQEIWQQLHQIALNFPVPAECDSCTYRYAARNCPVAHQAEKGHADPEQCKWCRAAVAAGLVPLAE